MFLKHCRSEGSSKVKKVPVILLLLILYLVLLCTGCNKKGEKEIQPFIAMDLVRYKVDNLTAFTVDEEGFLYTSGMKYDEANVEVTTIYINKYDLDGSLLYSFDFNDPNQPSIRGMAVHQNIVYFTVSDANQKGACIILYSFDINNERLEKLYELNNFVEAKQVLYLDNRVYLLGSKEYNQSSSMNKFEATYQSNGEELIYYSLEEKKVFDLGVDNPISMAKNEDGTLMIQANIKDQGYCMLRYNPNKDSLKALTAYETFQFERFAICNQGDSVIYTRDINSRGLVMSDISAIEEEAELYLDAIAVNLFGIQSVQGKIYCMSKSMDIIQFNLDSVQKKNKSLTYISSGYQPDEPFGCGYAMKRTELGDDKFALKVLAQDNDYDLCLMNTTSYSSYNIRENGIFYPLNEVKGIQEYLDLCFPYVKEAAINKNGDIWMIPIMVDIPGFLVNKETLAENRIDFKNDITYEEFYEMQDRMNESLNSKTSFNTYTIYLSFFAQTFNKSMDIEDDMFRSKLELFQKYDSLITSAFQTIDFNSEFLFSYQSSSNDYDYSFSQVASDTDLRVYSMPKLNSLDKNLGTCTFLAVNPNSKNKEEALAYIANWIQYYTSQDKVPLFFQQPVQNEDTLRSSLYELYRNGEITFYIDRDIYIDGFFDVIENHGDIETYIKDTRRKLDTYFNE